MRLFAPHRRLRFLLALMFLMAGCTLNNVTAPNQSVSGAPTVRILSPQPNATYFEGITVIIQATVANAGSDVNRVEVVVDGSTVTTLSEPNPNDTNSFSINYGWAASGVGTHTISVVAFRADGSSSSGDGGSVQIMVQAPNNTTQSQTQPTRASGNATATQGQGQTQPTQAPQVQSNATTAATAVPATAEPTTNATPSRPTATFSQASINVRRGPALEFDPPIGAFTQGQSTEILAINPAGTWYKVRYGGGEGWVFAALTDASGDIASLPRESGPPVPTAPPVQPTAVPATQVPPPPASSANLVAGIVELQPGEPVCQQTFNIGLDVANLGTQATSASGTVSVRDVRTSDGSTQQETTGGYPVLQPNETFRVNMPFTVSTWYGETHTIILIIDPSNQVAETNEGDNRREIQYTLQKGNCG